MGARGRDIVGLLPLRFVLVCFVYAVGLAFLSLARPFWLDEVLQAIGTRDLSGGALLHYVATFPGAAPLAYLAQHGSVSAMGFSRFSARLPSLVCSGVSCAGIVLIWRRLRLPYVWFPLGVWMLLPLPLRYAVEARPYGQALMFSVLATFFLLRPEWLGYSGAVLLGVYTAPYTLFLQAGQALGKQWKLTLGILFLCGCAYLPWYFMAKRYWAATLATSPDITFTITPKFFLLPVQEISGGGYACSIPLLLLAGWGCRSRLLPLTTRRMLALGAVSGLAGVLAMDLVFGYFFAIRQAMFILVPLVILAGAGFALLADRQQWWLSGALAALLFGGAVYKDVRYFSDTSEDWAAGARAVEILREQGLCVRFLGNDDARIYGFFEPRLRRAQCPADAAVFVAPEHRYTQEKDRIGAGFQAGKSLAAGGTTATVYTRMMKVP